MATSADTDIAAALRTGVASAAGEEITKVCLGRVVKRLSNVGSPAVPSHVQAGSGWTAAGPVAPKANPLMDVFVAIAARGIAGPGMKPGMNRLYKKVKGADHAHSLPGASQSTFPFSSCLSYGTAKGASNILGALNVGLSSVNVALGVVNLGVSVATYRRLEKMESRQEEISKELAASLHNVEEGQRSLLNALEVKAQFLADQVQNSEERVLHAVRSTEATLLSRLDQQDHDAVHRVYARVRETYKACLQSLLKGEPLKELGALKVRAQDLRAEVDTLLAWGGKFPLGDPRRVPLLEYLAFGVRAEIDAHGLENLECDPPKHALDGQSTRLLEDFQRRIEEEYASLCEEVGQTPYQLLMDAVVPLAQYAAMHRAAGYVLAKGQYDTTVGIMEADGNLAPLQGTERVLLDDGLDELREILEWRSDVQLESDGGAFLLLTVEDLAWYVKWKELPLTTPATALEGARVPYSDLLYVLGAPEGRVSLKDPPLAVVEALKRAVLPGGLAESAQQKLNAVMGWEAEPKVHVRLREPPGSKLPADDQDEKAEAARGLTAAEVETELGRDFIRANNPEKNYKAAAVCFRNAANRNHADAQYELGKLYQWGLGVVKNKTEERDRLFQAAEQGHVLAKGALAIAWMREKDERGRNMWRECGADVLARAEGQGADIAAAQVLMGLSCQWGGLDPAKLNGVAPEVEARKWFTKASRGDWNEWAEYYLGVLCETHPKIRGKEQSEALECFGAAALKGNPVAQFKLGQLLYDGSTSGLFQLRKDKDAREAERLAVRLFKESAAQGYSDASHYLGKAYLSGKGVERKDECQAQEWHMLAMQQGDTRGSAEIVKAKKWERVNSLEELVNKELRRR